MARVNDSFNDFSDDFGADTALESDQQFDIQQYVRILRKHKWAITLFTALITGLAGYYAYTATPIYSATSTLLIEPQGQNVVSIDELVGFDTKAKDYYETQFELLRSRGLAYRVVSALNLWEHPNFSSSSEPNTTLSPGEKESSPSNALNDIVSIVSEKLGMSDKVSSGIETNTSSVTIDLDKPTTAVNSAAPATGASTNSIAPENVPEFSLSIDADTLDRLSGAEGLSNNEQVVLGRFRSKMTITPLRNTKLVKISFESADPVLAARVANAIGEQYILSHLDAKLELTAKASAWLNERLSSLKATLDASEKRLIDFKLANGLVDVDGSVGRLNEQELLLTTAELAQARSEVAAQESLFREVQSLRDQPELLQSIPAVQADPLVQRTKIDQGQVQRQLDELRNRYGERHPRVVDATSQLDTLNVNLEGHMARVIGSISNDYQQARLRLASIESKLAAGKQEIQAIGSKKFELDSLEREVTTNRNIYDTYYKRITEANSADGLDSANARISDYAITPLGPIKPKKQLIIALAALGALVLSMLMAFLYEQLDDTIKGVADIEEKVGLKLLGILPLVKSGLLRSSNTLPLHPEEVPDPKGTFAESVNTIRTSLAVGNGAADHQVYLVTSSIPGEGKSTTSINLAYSMARIERVLLIDCDLRRPTVAKAIGIDKSSPGLTSLLTQTASARECIKTGAFSVSLDVLPSGPIPNQPLELLSSKRFEKILDQLRKHYDRIVIDCAPTQAVSDALILGRLCDATVYAIRSHDTSIDLIKRGVQRLREAGVHIAGALVTQVDIDKITSYGGDYYYQGYYDYYGYRDKDEMSKNNDSRKFQLSQQELMELKRDDVEVELGLSSVRNSSPSFTKTRRSEVNDDLDLTVKIYEGESDTPAAMRRNSRVRNDLDIL